MKCLKLKTLIPKYTRIPLLIVLAFNLFTYYGTMLINTPERYHLISTAFDDSLPLVPAFIFIYVLAFVQWGVGFIIIARESRERCYRVLSGELIAKLIAFCIFLIYPTTMERVANNGTGLAGFVLGIIYTLDTPAVNLFPSLHCLESWLCFRGAIGIRQFGKWSKGYVWFQLVFTLLVFAATLLTKQHVWPDILGGVAVAELGQLLSRLTHADRLMAKTEKLHKGSIHE